MAGWWEGMKEEGRVMNEPTVAHALLKGFVAHIFVIKDFLKFILIF